MTPKTILVLILAAAVAIGGIFYFVNLGRVLDRSGAIDSLVTPILEKFGLVEEDLVRESREVGRKGLKRYLHTFREYSAGGVDFKKFTQALEAGLKKTPYLLARRDYFLARGEEEAYYVVRFKEFDLFSMRLKKKALARPAAPAKKRFANPRVVIVLDDFGNNMNNVEALFSIGIPVTLSILPNLKYSSRIAREALDRGYEVILHLPLEPHRKDVVEEQDSINSRLTDSEVLGRLRRDIESIPGLVGVSNHMGSKATEEEHLMEVIFKELKARNLFFLDSFVTKKSVCEEVAEKAVIKYARRSIFLDNRLDDEYIRGQIDELKDVAFRTGSCIGIGHDRKATVRVLAEALPELESEGVRFVKLSEVVR